MISFHVDSEKTALQILQKVKLVLFAESLGGTESLITYPTLQTHPDVPQKMREHLGITERFCVCQWGWKTQTILLPI